MKRVHIAGLVLVGTLLWLAGSHFTGAAPGQEQASRPTCVDSLQARIDETATGDTLVVTGDCIYREQVFVTRAITLIGQGGAEIRGSDVWADWFDAEGIWVSALVVPPFSSHGECDMASDGRCLWPEQVFLNGEPLRQVAMGTTPAPGQFALDGERRVVLADDPTAALVEVTTRDRWMTLEAPDITVRGFVMLHAAADSQTGGVEVDTAPNWVVEDSDLSFAHGANLYVRDAPGGLLVGNVLHHGGQLGMGGYSDSITIRANHIHANNTEDFSGGWEAGGMKITDSQGVVIEANEVGSNLAVGIWCDIDCLDTSILDNAVHSNSGVGIMFEISDGAEIRGNRVWGNGLDPESGGWAYDSGILIASSRNANVYDNVVAWNGDGIAVISQCRAYLADKVTCNLEHPWNAVYGNEIHDNVIVMPELDESEAFALAWLCDILDPTGMIYSFPFTPEAANRGYGNSYWIAEGELGANVHFAWDHVLIVDLDAFNATPGEEGARYLDDSGRDQILVDAGIPVEPDPEN